MPDDIPLIEPVVGERELSNVREVLDSGHLTQGPFAREFERRFTDRVGTSHAIATTSCTVGMELALDALGIGNGDEVVVPDFTYPATATAVVRVGAEPVLVDVDQTTYTVTPDALEEAITDCTEALLPVSWGGQPLPTDPIADVASEYGLSVVEDAACSVDAAWNGDPVGSQFDVSVFSLHPRKVLTTGEGGVITTDDDELASEMRSIKNFGTDQQSDDIEFVHADATNARFSDVQAAIGVAQLDRLDDVIDRRRELARRYTDRLETVDGIEPPHSPPEAAHTYQSYCVYIEAGDDRTRDTILEELAEQNIEAQIGTYSLHQTDAFANADRVGELTTSTSLHRNLLTLPLSYGMTHDQQDRVVNAVVEALEGAR